jgi:hypothetical protein
VLALRHAGFIGKLEIRLPTGPIRAWLIAHGLARFPNDLWWRPRAVELSRRSARRRLRPLLAPDRDRSERGDGCKTHKHAQKHVVTLAQKGSPPIFQNGASASSLWVIFAISGMSALMSALASFGHESPVRSAGLTQALIGTPRWCDDAGCRDSRLRGDENPLSGFIAISLRRRVMRVASSRCGSHLTAALAVS